MLRFWADSQLFDPPSQNSFVRSMEGSLEVGGDGCQPDVEAQEFPCSHLVWLILLKKDVLREYAGSQSIGQLVIGSEGLSTLAWGLGVSSPSKSVSDSLSGPSANAVQEPTLPQARFPFASTTSRVGVGRDRRVGSLVPSCGHVRQLWDFG